MIILASKDVKIPNDQYVLYSMSEERRIKQIDFQENAWSVLFS